MKTQFIAFTALLVALNMTSCKDKNESDETTTEVSTTTTQDSIDLYNESSGTGSTTGNDVSGSNSGSVENNNTSENSGSTSTSSPTSKNATTGKKAPVKKGYSAPDGTDAENHDGDMYTKHDTTRMPSGPPIK